MRREWLCKAGNGRVVVFFNGWGMDGEVVKHLKGETDVVMFYDYRDLHREEKLDLSAYRRVDVVAWSMGVWAAAQVVPSLGISPSKQIALNGTERPVDDRYGIPVRIYGLTEKGMTGKGREKFVARMLDNRPGNPVADFTTRPIEEVCEELSRIRESSADLRHVLKWDRAYISENDVIFPVTGQREWWSGRCLEICMLPGGHFPFDRFENWEEIIGG